jgi:4-amino-4-deoxy-L-arabinose transferase-like glycosyltransferase
MLLATAVRLYLVRQYFCISSDGVRYIQAAQDFYAGNVTAGLSSLYPPLYPLMIAVLYPLIGDWEVAGQFWSLLAGVLVLIPLFLLLRRIYGTHVAVVGAFLAAIAPFLARYSAHVRSESPFILLSTVALLLFHAAIKDRLWSRFFYGGLITGLAYLIRPEAIGFLAVIPAALLVEWCFGKTVGLAWVFGGSLLTLLGFLIFAFPYAAHLAADTGDWGAVSRKTNLAIWYGFKDSGILDDEELAAIRAPGAPGLVEFFLDHPFAYIKKIALGIPPSLGVYFEAIHYSYLPFFLLGVFHAVRRKFWEQADLLLFLFVAFFIAGFAALYVNLRYAIQLIPASLGWVATGLIWCMKYDHFKRHLSPRAFQATAIALGLVFIGGTLGKTLRPIAREKAHVRASGAYLKALGGSDGLKVLVFDNRITFYAGADAVLLNELDEQAVIRVLRKGGVDYVATEAAPWQERFPSIAKDPPNYGLVLEKVFRASGKGKILLFKVRSV